jgi:hypothetical protein
VGRDRSDIRRALSFCWFYIAVTRDLIDSESLLVKLKPRIFQRLPPFEYMAAMLVIPTR